MLTLKFADGSPPKSDTARMANEWFDECGQFCGRAFSFGELRWIEWAGLGLFVFSVGSREVRVWPNLNVSRDAVKDTFFRMLQPVILQALGWQTLHASATVVAGGVVAFCGRSNSGKSTLAFAMRQVGGQQVSDDSLVWQIDHRSRAVACPLPFTPRFRPATIVHFANLTSSVETSLAHRQTEVPLLAVFLLSQEATLTRPRIFSVPRAEVFAQVLAHAHCFDEGDRALTRELAFSYLELASSVPVFTLNYPPGFQYLSDMTHVVLETATSVSVTGASAALSGAASCASRP